MQQKGLAPHTITYGAVSGRVGWQAACRGAEAPGSGLVCSRFLSAISRGVSCLFAGGRAPWSPVANNQSACWLFVGQGLARCRRLGSDDRASSRLCLLEWSQSSVASLAVLLVPRSSQACVSHPSVATLAPLGCILEVFSILHSSVVGHACLAACCLRVSGMHLAGFCDHTVIAAFGEATLGEGKQKPQP